LIAARHNTHSTAWVGYITTSLILKLGLVDVMERICNVERPFWVFCIVEPLTARGFIPTSIHARIPQYFTAKT
jgi:hypothetical protein